MKNKKTTGKIFVFFQFALASAFILGTIFENRLTEHPQYTVIKIISVIFLILGFLTVSAALISFRQMITPNPVPLDSAELRTGGIYSYIRHPMYTSVILVFIGFSLFMNAYIMFFSNIVVVIFLIIKINFEESRLLEKFQDYDAYRKKTKRLIPFIY